jgi:Ca2+-transporting ATPase
MITLFASGTSPNAADEAYARTMAFTTLMMFQLFNALNCRSAWRSAFSGFFENKWLLLAIALSVLSQLAVVYVPVMQEAFRAVPLTLRDWAVAVGVGLVLLLVVETGKLAFRIGLPERHGLPIAGEHTAQRV